MKGSRQVPRISGDSLDLHCAIPASFHLHHKADFNTSFRSFLSAVPSVVNDGLGTHRSHLVRRTFDTSDVSERVSCPIIGHFVSQCALVQLPTPIPAVMVLSVVSFVLHL